MQVKHLDTPIGTKTRQRLPCIRIENARSSAQAMLLQPLINDGRPLQSNLQAQESSVGRGFGTFKKKTTSPWTDLDLDRTLAWHEGIDVDFAFPGKTSGMSVGMIGSRLEHHDGRQTSTLARRWVALVVVSSRP